MNNKIIKLICGFIFAVNIAAISLCAKQVTINYLYKKIQKIQFLSRKSSDNIILKTEVKNEITSLYPELNFKNLNFLQITAFLYIKSARTEYRNVDWQDVIKQILNLTEQQLYVFNSLLNPEKKTLNTLRQIRKLKLTKQQVDNFSKLDSKYRTIYVLINIVNSERGSSNDRRHHSHFKFIHRQHR